jgi:hypothetical protein
MAKRPKGAVADPAAAAGLLNEWLKLPEWAGSVSAGEEDGTEVIVVQVEHRYAHELPMLPKAFEGYPVIIQIRPTRVTH